MDISDPTPPIPPFGDPNQALFNGTGNLSPDVADARELPSPIGLEGMGRSG